MNTPLRFQPFLRPMVWGGRRLGDILHKSLPTAEPYGESWEVSDHPLHHSRVATGPRAGQSLRQLMETDASSLLGRSALVTFPWLVKFLDASDWLSVQVHPSEECVGRLWPGEGSKTEAWFIVDAAPGSRIYAGLRPGVDEGELRRRLKEGTVADCLHDFEPRPGDCVFLPAGTVHAVGGGVLIAEIQQTSDATFRLFDWNRRDAEGKSRKLHVEEALACIDWSGGPVTPVRAEGFAEHASADRRQKLVSCPYFRIEYVHETKPLVFGGAGHLQLLIVLRGRGRWQQTAEEATAGQVWLLPAAMPRMSCQLDEALDGLIATLP